MQVNRGPQSYEGVYYGKRNNLNLACLRLFLGQDVLTETELNILQNLIHDYLWSICEETNWVLPAHEPYGPVDLMAAGTALELAEILELVGDLINTEVQNRVRAEIERRVFTPYFEHHSEQWWYKEVNNWSSVCNSSIAATFLWLERDTHRLAQVLHIALEGLQHYLAYAFEEDGTSTEGVNYWHYGLMHFVTFSEMLLASTEGQLNLLASDRMRTIAAYPSKLHLSGSMFAPFADCPDNVEFAPCILARLAQRSGESSILGLATPGEEHKTSMGLAITLRNLIWDTKDLTVAEGGQAQEMDAFLPAGGIARVTALTGENQPVILIAKAGHNNENHNHNDIGSFVLHIGGENFLSDPGLGLYTRDYFNSHRYENIFTNSYGHSVPRVNGQLQGTGREFSGQIIKFVNDNKNSFTKEFELEFSKAYPVSDMVGLRRQFLLTLNTAPTTVVWLHDYFKFESRLNQEHKIEEAFMTWLNVEVEGTSALIKGRQNWLRLTVQTLSSASFHLESLEQESKANKKEAVLKRLTLSVPVEETTSEIKVSVRMDLLPRL